MYGVIERETNKTLNNIKKELKVRVVVTFTKLSKEIVEKACGRFRGRMEPVVYAIGDFFG